jgi:hypothetical protein
VLTSYLVSNAIILPGGRLGFERHRSQEFLSAMHHHLHRGKFSLRYRSNAPDLAYFTRSSFAMLAAVSSLPSLERSSPNRSLFHQARLQESMQPGNPAYVNQVNALTSYFGGGGRGPGPGFMARAAIYQQLNQQGRCAGLSGQFTVCSVGNGHGGARLDSKQEQARTGRPCGRSNALAISRHQASIAERNWTSKAPNRV